MEVPGRSHTGSEDANTIMECDPCSCDSKTVTAKCYCKECNEYLCDNCTRAHKHSRVSKHHDLLYGDEIPRKKLTSTPEKNCSKHGDMMVQYFCENHDQLCCLVCVTTGHSQCGVQYIDDIAGEFNTSQEYQDLLKQITLLEAKLTEIKKQSDKNCDDVNQYFTTLISDIEYFRAQFNTKLDKLENKVREEAQKIKTDDLKSLESISTQSECIQKHLGEITPTLESMEEYKQNQQLFITAKRILKQVQDYKKQIDNISIENNIRTYLFSWNEELLQSLDTCCELVHLNVKESGKIYLRNEKQNQRKENILYEDPKNIKATFLKKINIQHKMDKSRYCWITGSDMLTGDKLALTDNCNFSIKLVDLHTDTVISCLELTDKPRDLTCIDSNRLVVTSDTNLTFLKFDEELSIVKQVQMEGGCHGITSHQNKLFVTFIGEKPSVKVLNSGGAVLYTIQSNSQGQNLFVEPRYITLSAGGQTLYVSDWEQNTVTSYSVTGEQLNVYKHEALNGPVGLTLIENKFVFVSGNGSCNVHEISHQCKHIQILLDNKDVGGRPCTVLYNRTNRMIYTSCGVREYKFVSVYKLEQTNPEQQ